MPPRPLGNAPVGGETPRARPLGHPQPQAPSATPFALPGIERPRLEPNLNPRYQLERFVGGDSNAVPLTTAQAIADKPGNTSFNPLLLYGGVGLGKTHLMQAIGNHVLQTRPELVVRYITSDDFTNEFVAAIRENKGNEFSMTYRAVDVLLVDDVQFLSGREKTQDEFFHLFNKLYQDGKQIVLTSDQPPREIKGVEQRLVSRFAWGVVLEVKPPGLETRMAILQRKAEDEGLDVGPDIIEFIAHNITSNVRELEGAMIRLLARAGGTGQELTLAMAKEALRDLVQHAPKGLTVEEIMQVVAEETGVDPDTMRAKTRKSGPVRARQLAMFLAKQYTAHSLKQIGTYFGGRDHSTVIHAVKKVENDADVDVDYRATLDALERKIELRRR
jgi:chromosomal replication initiator protein